MLWWCYFNGTSRVFNFLVFYQTKSLLSLGCCRWWEREHGAFGFTCSCAKRLMGIIDNKIIKYACKCSSKIYYMWAVHPELLLPPQPLVANSLLASSIEGRELIICIVTSLLIPSKSLTYSRTPLFSLGFPSCRPVKTHHHSLYLDQSSRSWVPDKSLDWGKRGYNNHLFIQSNTRSHLD